MTRSTLEARVKKQLEDSEQEYVYEKESWTWYESVGNGLCRECGSNNIHKKRSYTPDFFLGNGIVVEVKGRLTSFDRKLLKSVKEQRPGVDLRLVFDKNNRIYKGAKTRYSEWAEKHGFRYSLKGQIPQEWLGETR